MTEACCLPCGGTRTQDWVAFIDRRPPPWDDPLHVSGEVLVPNLGANPLLAPREPQGIDHEVLLLDLFLCQEPGAWPQVLVWKPVRYDKVIGETRYRQVQVFCSQDQAADIPVREIS